MAAEHLGNNEAGEGKSRIDYAALYDAAHPDLIKDPAKAEAIAYAGKDRVEAAMQAENDAKAVTQVIGELNVIASLDDHDPAVMLERESLQETAQAMNEVAAQHEKFALRRMEQADKDYESKAQ